MGDIGYLSSIFEMSTTWTKPFLQPASTKIMNPAPFMGKLINDFNRGQNLSENFLRLGFFWDVSNLVVFTKYRWDCDHIEKQFF